MICGDGPSIFNSECKIILFASYSGHFTFVADIDFLLIDLSIPGFKDIFSDTDFETYITP